MICDGCFLLNAAAWTKWTEPTHLTIMIPAANKPSIAIAFIEQLAVVGSKVI